MSNGNYLSWKVMDPSHFFEKKSSNSTGSIALVGIVLDNKSLLQFWPMVFFMLIHKIWVNSMSHICRNCKKSIKKEAFKNPAKAIDDVVVNMKDKLWKSNKNDLIFCN